MAFTPEDGTGVPDANSYATVEEADAYFLDRNVESWGTLTRVQKEGALVSATEYIDLRWQRLFPGRKAYAEQVLGYPRVSWCVRESEIPVPVLLPLNLVRATLQYALIAKDGPLAPNPVVDPSGVSPTYVREKVGPLEEERRWGTTAVSTSAFRTYGVADGLMGTLFEMGGRGRVFR